MEELLRQIIENPLPSLAIIGNLILIEGLLSVDNAAVLATMVMDLPHSERKKALRYGIWGAYLFRGIALVSASFLISIWWLKLAGGLYLLYLFIDWFIKKRRQSPEEVIRDKEGSWFYRVTVRSIGNFWATVVLVELMDIAFSIDNVFAAVAFTKNIILVCTGVFIGILAMRFIAQWFVKLMETYTFLEASAYIVIGILGIKLSLSVYEHYDPNAAFTRFMLSSQADFTLSLLTVVIFLVPVITSWLLGFPRKHT
jgi:YkoY family integral membrane protein